MSSVTINLLGWNHRHSIGATLAAATKQSHPAEVVQFMDNASTDGSAEYVKQNFLDVRVVRNERNLGYAGGHNRAFKGATTDLIMVLNPDVILDNDFLKNAIPIFDDPKVAAVTGKMLKPTSDGRGILDGTGIIVSRSRRGRERGQWEQDSGQFDASTWVFGVSGTAAIYRKSALDVVCVRLPGQPDEYFDEDFFAYWEDLDLSWRLRLAGFECRFVPEAVAWHERTASSSPRGYTKLPSFIGHRRAIPLSIKRWNWKNHLFCIIKNDFGWPMLRDLPLILAREVAMLIFILIFEIRTLSVLPDFLRQLPKMLVKRRLIQSHRRVLASEVSDWFGKI